MTVVISELPLSVQNKIPISIRTYKDEYELEELPPTIRELISPYLEKQQEINYDLVYSVNPEISEYGDLRTINNLYDLVTNYLVNYFLTLPGDYPFDATFGSKLKYHLQTRDTNLRNTLITNEVNRVVGVVSKDLKVNIEVADLEIQPISYGASVDYNIFIKLLINDNPRNINLSIQL